MVKESQLRVAEAKQRDVGRGKIRLDSLSMRTIGSQREMLSKSEGKKSPQPSLGLLTPKIKEAEFAGWMA